MESPPQPGSSSPFLSRAEFDELIRLGEIYGTDGKHIYAGYRRIEGADVESFRLLSEQYASDRAHLYFEFFLVPTRFHGGGAPYAEVDRDSFEVLGKDFARDRTHLYWRNDIVYGVAPGGVTYLSEHFLVDAERAYYFYAGLHRQQLSEDQTRYLGICPQVLPDANARRFRVLGAFYGSDGERVFWMTDAIPGAHPGTIEYLKDAFAKDATAVYFMGAVLDAADPLTFQILGDTRCCKDRYRVWEYAHDAGEHSACVEIEGADPTRFDPAAERSRHFAFLAELDD
ncbi:MAG TPA: DKNYY domain-containing protein [Polyangiaceae bacterium]